MEWDTAFSEEVSCDLLFCRLCANIQLDSVNFGGLRERGGQGSGHDWPCSACVRGWWAADESPRQGSKERQIRGWQATSSSVVHAPVLSWTVSTLPACAAGQIECQAVGELCCVEAVLRVRGSLKGKEATRRVEVLRGTLGCVRHLPKRCDVSGLWCCR